MHEIQIKPEKIRAGEVELLAHYGSGHSPEYLCTIYRRRAKCWEVADDGGVLLLGGKSQFRTYEEAERAAMKYWQEVL